MNPYQAEIEKRQNPYRAEIERRANPYRAEIQRRLKGEDEIVDQSRGFLNNFGLSEINRAAKEDSMSAGIAKYATGRTKEEMTRRKKEAGLDTDPEQRYLSDQAEAAYQEGGYDSPEYQKAEAELNQYEQDKDPDFTLSALKDNVVAAWREDKGALGAVFAKAIIIDPEILFTPIGWEAAAAKVGKTLVNTSKAVQTIGKGAAGATGAGTVGGVIGAGISAAQQLGESGEIDTDQLINETGAGAAGGAIFGGVFAGFKAMAKSLSSASGKSTKEIARELQLGSEKGMSLEELGETMAAKIGMSEKQKLNMLKDVKRDMSSSVEAANFKRQKAVKDLYSPKTQKAIDTKNQRVINKAMDSQTPTKEWVPMGGSKSAKASRAMSAENQKFVDKNLKKEPGRARPDEKIKTDIASEERQRFVKAKLSDQIRRSETDKYFARPYDAPQETANKLMSSGKVEPYRFTLGQALRSTKKIDKARAAHKSAVVNALKAGKEVPEKVLRDYRGHLDERLLKQNGKVAPEMIAYMASVATGGLVGYGINGEEGALAGALLAGGGVFVASRLYKVAKLLKNGLKKSSREAIDIDGLANNWEAEMRSAMLNVLRMTVKIKERVPDLKRREAMTHWLEGNKKIKLNDTEIETATFIRKTLDDFSNFLKEEKLLDAFLEDYMPHFWRRGMDSKKGLLGKIQSPGTTGMKLGTMHTKKRFIPTYAEGIKMGLKPVSLDAADIMATYLNDVYRVVENRRLVNALMKEKDEFGRRLVQSFGKAPSDFVDVQHPSLRLRVWRKDSSGNKLRDVTSAKVHPDIATHMKFIFDNSDPNIIMRGLLALNFASKKSLVGVSFFHANALIESLIYAGSHPLALRRTLKLLNQGPLATYGAKGYAAKLLKYGTNGGYDIVDIAVRAGLKIGTIEDVGLKQAYTVFNAVGEGLVNITPTKLGKGVTQKTMDGVAAVTKKFDEIMWDKIMTGGKLTSFMREYEKAIASNARKHLKNPKKYPLVNKEKLAGEIAEYVNFAFGGLNWRRLARGARTEMGKKVMSAAYSPSGRRMMQLGLFAADWTIANLGVVLKAIPGVAKSKYQTWLHMKYAARGTAFLAIGGSLVNMYFTGKPIWENEDKTRASLGDGRSMTVSKQLVEPYHWITNPAKTAMNKIGIIPATFFQIFLNKKYLSPYGAPNIWKTRDSGTTIAAKIAKQLTYGKFAPISVQQIEQQGVAGMAGFVGHPIYGRTRAQKRAERRRNRRER